MRNLFIILLLFLVITACKNKNGRVTIENINEEIRRNENQVVFLSLFPNMSEDTKEFLFKKETKKNNLIVNQSEYDNDISLYYYPMELANEKLDFLVWGSKYNVSLSYEFEYYTENPYSNLIDDYEYKKISQEILKFYALKYGNYRVQRNIILENTKLEPIHRIEDRKKYYVFDGNNKIIAISGEFSYDYDPGGYNQYKSDKFKEVQSHSYRFEIFYYTKNSFKEMRKIKIKDSLEFIEKIKNKKNKKIREEIEKRKRLLDDI